MPSQHQVMQLDADHAYESMRKMQDGLLHSWKPGSRANVPWCLHIAQFPLRRSAAEGRLELCNGNRHVSRSERDVDGLAYMPSRHCGSKPSWRELFGRHGHRQVVVASPQSGTSRMQASTGTSGAPSASEMRASTSIFVRWYRLTTRSPMQTWISVSAGCHVIPPQIATSIPPSICVTGRARLAVGLARQQKLRNSLLTHVNN